MAASGIDTKLETKLSTGNLLFFDTETTGFVNKRAPYSDPSQPHTVQLAARLVTPGQRILSSINLMIALPHQVVVPERAAAVHGISTEMANKYGFPGNDALNAFARLFDRCSTLVAHNIEFDLIAVGAAAARYFGGKSLDLKSKKHFCTMNAATHIVDLPPTAKMLAAGFDKPKPPRLEECVKHFFDESLEGAHDAMIDVDACQRVYFHLKSMEAADA